jgi:rhamnogalacturonan endolyase
MKPAKTELTRRTALGLLGGAAAATTIAAAARPTAAAAAVSLVDNGASVTLGNGLVSATVTKDTAQIRDLRLVGSAYGNEGFNLVSGSNGQGYTTFDYYVGTTRFSKGLSGAAYRVAQQTADRVEIVMGQADEARRNRPQPALSAANVGQMWAGAKLAAEREQAKWPYAWVGDPLYAAAERSTVRGKLTIVGHARPEGAAASSSADATAWVVLSQDQPDRVYQGIPLDGRDWQYQNLGYVYYARAGHDGHFAVPAVRPGTYRLTAFADGVLGEVSTTGVEIPPATTVDTGNHLLHPDDHGVTLWQIGRPNRSAAESHVYGGPSGFRHSLTWLEYPYEFPDGVDFRVGVDDVAEKWNYFQPCYRTPGSPLQLQLRGTAQDYSLTRWRIRFDSRGFRGGLAALDIALAASVFGNLQVSVNGATVASFDPLPGPAGDNSSYRLACRGMYRRLPPIRFDARLIKRGANVVDLSPVRPPVAPLTRGNTVDNWMEPIAGVMYDVIRLQVEED